MTKPQINLKELRANLTQSEYHRYLGEYFGYPECCIEYFVRTAPFAPVAMFTDLLYGRVPKEKKQDWVLCPACRLKTGTVPVPLDEAIEFLDNYLYTLHWKKGNVVTFADNPVEKSTTVLEWASQEEPNGTKS